MAFLLSHTGSEVNFELPTPIFWHLPLVEYLRNEDEPKPWTGESAVAWASRFDAELSRMLADSGLPELQRPLDRTELKAFCGQTTVCPRFRLAAVLAFGGANVRKRVNNTSLWASLDNWIHLLDELPFLSRAEAYKRFKKLRDDGKIPGMGPSFFTKLIYFFGKGDGYILDQWLAKAIHVLNAANWVISATGEPEFRGANERFPRLIPSGQGIHDSNTAEDYEVYCRAVESLTTLLRRVDGADTERWLFSYPGSPWRRLITKLTKKQKA